MNFSFSSISEYADGLRAQKFSATEVIRELCDRITREDTTLHSFLSVHTDDALRMAHETDERIAHHTEKGILDGVPIAIKDNILIHGHQTTAASNALASYVAAYDATVIEKLKHAGAILIGKTNLDEFAMGSSTETSAFGVTKHPLDTTKVPGGSSGGSAAAVAADFALGALGTDTGGSIRQPAGFCGVVGLKPTYGAVSRYGVIALASSLDQVGPLTKTVEDAAHVFAAISGKDVHDATSRTTPFRIDAIYDTTHARSRTIGVIREFMEAGMSSEVQQEVSYALEQFKKAGYRIREISLPHIKYALSCYYIILPAEASANLARYDGLRYGQTKEYKSLLDAYICTRGEGFGDEVKRRILLGTFVLSSGYYDAYYAKAQKVRRLIQEDFLNAFHSSTDGVDVLFAPVTPTQAFDIGEKSQDPLAMYLSDMYTIPVNLAGLPAISIPVHKTYTKEHLPVGFQLIGKHWGERDILGMGYDYEKNLRE